MLHCYVHAGYSKRGGPQRYLQPSIDLNEPSGGNAVATATSPPRRPRRYALSLEHRCRLVPARGAGGGATGAAASMLLLQLRGCNGAPCAVQLRGAELQLAAGSTWEQLPARTNDQLMGASCVAPTSA